MAPSCSSSSSSDCPVRRLRSKQLTGTIFYVSAVLAVGSCFLTMLYVAYTSIFFPMYNNALQTKSPLDNPIIYRSSQRRFSEDNGPFRNFSEDFLLEFSERLRQLSHPDGGGDQVDDASSSSTTAQLDSKSIANTTISPDISQLEDTDESSSSNGSHSYDYEVFHDEDIFFKSYQEMNRSLKIYIYPHERHDRFANVLLPVNEEPGGNYASEAYFKNTLMKSHFITEEPSKADFFFLPFSIARMRNDRRIGVGGLATFVRDYVDNVVHQFPYWNCTGGADHFYVACHSIGRLALSKADQVKSNAIQVVCSSSYFLPNYFSHKDVALPQVWPRHEKLDLASSKRNTLAFFAGAMNSPVRRYLHNVWEDDPDIFVHEGRLPTPYSKQLLGSKFCLHVKGYEVNTARLGDAMYYGCVPVIIADHYDLPFMDILNWESFSVVVTVSDIPNLKKILQGISSEEYGVLQSNVLRARKHFQWNRLPTDYDAFHMVMFELWLRRGSVRLST